MRPSLLGWIRMTLGCPGMIVRPFVMFLAVWYWCWTVCEMGCENYTLVLCVSNCVVRRFSVVQISVPFVCAYGWIVLFSGCFLQVFIIADLALGFVKRADILVWMGMNWDRMCFCSWFNADEPYGWVWIGTNACNLNIIGQTKIKNE